jgi:hypothetical protein
MRNGMERHLRGEGRVLVGEIPCRPDEGGWGSLGVQSAVERDVEISGGLGRSEPFALAAMQCDQVFQNPSGLAIWVAFHQIAPHGEPGVARCRG